jgi:hypothetical protein
MKSYFIQLRQNTQCSIRVSGIEPGSGTSDLSKGWNMISADKSWNEIKNDCQIKGTTLSHYNPAKKAYDPISTSESLNSSQNNFGYFVEVKGECQIQE